MIRSFNFRMFWPHRTLQLSALMLLVIASGGTARAADSAASSSPFLPPSAQTAAAPTQDATLELRGIIAEGDATMFSIYDATHHISFWTKLDEKGHPFVVRSYDAQRDAVTVEYQGRTLNLALRTAKVASAPATPHLVASSPPAPAPQPIGGPVVLNPTPADEQRRLEAIAAEVNRRRMIRQQALQANRQAAGQYLPGQGPQRTPPTPNQSR